MSLNRSSMPAIRGHERHAVWLRVYDISNGKAATWSQLVLGKKIEGVWHTGVFVFGLEYFYGGGIDCMPPNNVESVFDMEIVEVQLLGYTTRTRTEFERFLSSLRHKFTPDTYDLSQWNCNHFSDTCSRFLLNDRGIPEHILDLPDTIASSFIGDLIIKFFKRLHRGRNPCNSIDDPDHPRFEFECVSRSRRSSVHSTRRSSMTRSRRRSLSCGPPDDSSSDSSSNEDHHHNNHRHSNKFSNPKSSLCDPRLQPPTYPLLLRTGRRASSHTNPSKQLQTPSNPFLRSRASHHALIGRKEPLWASPPPSPILQPSNPFHQLPPQQLPSPFSSDLDLLKHSSAKPLRFHRDQNSLLISDPKKSSVVLTPPLQPRRLPPQHKPSSSAHHYTPPRTPPLDPVTTSKSQKLDTHSHIHRVMPTTPPTSRQQAPKTVVSPISIRDVHSNNHDNNVTTKKTISKEPSSTSSTASTSFPIARQLVPSTVQRSSAGPNRLSKSELESALIVDVNRVMATQHQHAHSMNSHRSNAGRHKIFDGSYSIPSKSHSGDLEPSGNQATTHRSIVSPTVSPEKHSSSAQQHRTLQQSTNPKTIHSGDDITASSSHPFSMMPQGVHLSVPVVDVDDYHEYEIYPNPYGHQFSTMPRDVTFMAFDRSNRPRSSQRQQKTKTHQHPSIFYTPSLSEQSLSTAATTSSTPRTPTAQDRHRHLTPLSISKPHSIPIPTTPSTRLHQMSNHDQDQRRTTDTDSSRSSSMFIESKPFYKGLLQGFVPPSSAASNNNQHTTSSSHRGSFRCPECRAKTDRRSWMCDECGFDFMTWPLR